MKVLMLGWEFPPFFAGGVGIVCGELAKALHEKGVEITYIMPAGPENTHVNYVKMLIANNIIADARIRIKKVGSLLTPYSTSQEYAERYKALTRGKHAEQIQQIYGRNLQEEIYRFAEKAKLIALEEEFDVIHAHDWVTFPAAIEIKKATGKPLVVHVHITEFDKTGGMHANSFTYQIEREGMMQADKVIAVSNLIKNRCIYQYYIPAEKIEVVYNAAIGMNEGEHYNGGELKKDKIVLFAGRVTLQKGPDYFVEAAKKVLEKDPNVTFIVAGTGDMLPRIIDRAAELGISHKFIFTGFYNREQAEKLFSMADVFVMPSVSEPFGVVPYEAQIKKTPTIVSKQSGISELLHHTLKVDFWDINDMASKILALLHYNTLHEEMAENGYHEAKKSNWEGAATKCLNIYKQLTGK